jgi:hypothetical protein
MPAAKLSAVNLSSGYYNPHNTNEYVIYDEMIDTADAVRVLIKENCDGPFEYIAKTYSFSRQASYKPNYSCTSIDMDDNRYFNNFFEDTPFYSDDRLAHVAKYDTDLELEVTIYGKSLSEESLIASGETKAECWMNLFIENPNLCFNDIVDYTFS